MPEESANRSSFSLLRRWGIGINVVISALALFAIVCMVNYLSSRHFRRFEWTEDPRFALAPQTRQLLLGLTNDIQVTVLFDPEESPLYGAVKGLLKEYELASRHLRVEYVNHVQDPGRAQELRARYKLTGADTLLVIFEGPGGRPPRIVRERELSDYDIQGLLHGQPARRTGFKGEQFFTAALFAVSEAEPIRGRYLTGHGEPGLESEEEPDAMRRLADLLRQKNIELEPLSLASQEIPADCPLLVVAGVRTAMSAGELDAVQRYLQGGGRALFLLSNPRRNENRRTGLERLLADWGVEVGNNWVIDRAQSRGHALLTSGWGDHPITRPLTTMRLELVAPCSVRRRPSPSRTTEITVSELVFTSPDGMTSDAGSERGTIPLAVAVEKGSIAEVSADRGTTRLVVVGDVTFLANVLIEAEANLHFANLAVNWLLDRGHVAGIGPRSVKEYRITLSAAQMKAVQGLLLGALPGGVLAVGVLVWLRRRK